MTSIEIAKIRACEALNERYNNINEERKRAVSELHEIFKRILKSDEFYDYINFIDWLELGYFYDYYGKLFIINEIEKKWYAKEYVKLFMSFVGAYYKNDSGDYFGVFPVHAPFGLNLSCEENCFRFYICNYSYQYNQICIKFSDDDSQSISFSYSKATEIKLLKDIEYERKNNNGDRFLNLKENYFYTLFLSDRVKKPIFTDFAPVFDPLVFKRFLNSVTVSNVILIELKNGRKELVFSPCNYELRIPNDYSYEHKLSGFDIRDIKSVNTILQKKMFAFYENEVPDEYYIKLSDNYAQIIDAREKIDNECFVIATLYNDKKVILYKHKERARENDAVYYTAIYFLYDDYSNHNIMHIHGNYIKKIQSL